MHPLPTAIENIQRASNLGVAIGVQFHDREVDNLTERIRKREGVTVTDPAWDSVDKCERPLEGMFFDFLKRTESFGYTAHPTGSKYDIILHLECPDLPKFLLEAQKSFPAYTFTVTDDPQDNMLRHCDFIPLNKEK